MPERVNFTMMPNIAFEVLTNEFDLVRYQKLLRFVGVGNSWKGGNNALQKLLGISYGRVIKLKAKLLEVGFIEIIKGDNGHGEADEWKILDVFEYKAAPSQVEQGQKLVDGSVSKSPKCSQPPYHETDKPLSPGKQAALSPDEQHEEKIYSEEYVQDNFKESLSSSARVGAAGANRGLTAREAIECIDNPPRIPEENFSPTRAIEIWREIFPNAWLDVDKLKKFAAHLPEIEESVWRQNLIDWEISGWKATNISGIINRYESELKKWTNQQTKGTMRQNGKIKPHSSRTSAGKSEKPTNYEISRNRDYSWGEGFDPIAAFSEEGN